MKSINPATGDVVATYEPHDADAIEARIAAAAAAAPQWAATPIPDRMALLQRAADVLRDHVEPFARRMVHEMGKPIREARAEVEKCAWVFEHYAEVAPGLLQPLTIETDASRSEVRHDPLGVVLAVMPWNFPFWQVMRFAAPALAAGNVGLLKHASNVCGVSLDCERVFDEAGFPPGVFASLLVGSSEVKGIIEDDRVAAVTLTGSDAAGRAVASQAGAALKPCVLELGGSDPFVVLADADLDLAVEGAVKGRYQNTGQSCIAAKRFIVVDELHDAFVERFVEKVRGLQVGDPLDEHTDVGPMAQASLAADLYQQLKASVDAGARCLIGGNRPDDGSAWFGPAVLVDVPRDCPAAREELFGPVAAVFRAENAEDALRLARDTPFGLGASVWSANPDVDALAAQLPCGHVSFNGIVKSDPRLPFGGVKASGFGRELSDEGLFAFAPAKTVWVR